MKAITCAGGGVSHPFPVPAAVERVITSCHHKARVASEDDITLVYVVPSRCVGGACDERRLRAGDLCEYGNGCMRLIVISSTECVKQGHLS